MRKLLPFAVPFLLSVSLATPLIGSKGSFAESNFCRKWKCAFTSSRALPGSAGVKTFTYTLPDGATIDLTRDQSRGNIVLSSVLINYGDAAAERFISTHGRTGGSLPDLLYALTGVRTKADIYSECLNQNDGQLNFGPDHQLGRNTVWCTIGRGPVDSATFIRVYLLDKTR